MDFLPKEYAALNNYKQFIVYVLKQSSRPGKMDKLPVDYRTARTVNAHDSAIWMTAETAIAAAKALGAGYGVGFVLTKNDPFFFLDIDDCLDGQTWSTIATEMLKLFNGCAVEISQSQRGLHIIGSSPIIPPHACRNAEFKMELYSSGRFIALTGYGSIGDVAVNPGQTLEGVINTFFPVAVAAGVKTEGEWTHDACAEWRGNADDNELLNRALKSQSARATFGNGASFRDLWEANDTILAKAYPSATGDIYDRSAADAALAQHLAFWTGKNCERILKIMEGSALKREKWEREDYLPQTIRGACGRQKDVLKDTPPEYAIKPPEIQDDDNPRPKLKEGDTFLTIDQQIEYFDRCIYVMDEHKIMIKGGYMLTPDRFKSYFGGYQMPMDLTGEKVTRNAFEAFTESQAFTAPRAHSCCFLPARAPGGVVKKDGQLFANIYHPVNTPCIQGDVILFLNHMVKLFPDKRDREIVIAYLAAIIQYKGVKFQWCPLIQGVEGNGKTFLTRIVAFAIGERYSHFPKAAEISSKFNDWLYGRIFIGVEDIYLYDSRTEVIEALKPMITSERQEIEPKGGAKMTRDICANFIINTNHKEGLRKTKNDRRFAPFYTAQQSVEDLKRDGMNGDYFRTLYEWADKKAGYAFIHYYLAHYEIPDELNPATGCKRAPITSSTEEAIDNGMFRIEQEITEAIREERCGFRGNWISSTFLKQLLIEIKGDKIYPPRRRRALMQSLGYDWHPGLTSGQVHNRIQPDGVKSVLFVKIESKEAELTGGKEIADAYSRAQSTEK